MGGPALLPPLPLHPKVIPASLPRLKIAVGFVHGLAILATVFRVGYRRHKGRLGRDDVIAGVTCFLDTIFMITFMLRNNNAGTIEDPRIRRAYIVLHWFHIMLAPTVLWFSRFCILLGLNRITPPGHKLKRPTQSLSLVFIVMYIAVLSARIWSCGTTNRWHSNLALQCFLTDPVPEIELTCDVLADLALIAIPVMLLWNSRSLGKDTRRRVLFVFAMSIMITLANINFNVFVFGAKYWGGRVMVAVSSHIEGAIALLVCNFSVILPFIFRLYGFEDDLDDGSQFASKEPSTVIFRHGTELSVISRDPSINIQVKTTLSNHGETEPDKKRSLSVGQEFDELYLTDDSGSEIKFHLL